MCHYKLLESVIIHVSKFGTKKILETVTTVYTQYSVEKLKPLRYCSVADYA